MTDPYDGDLRVMLAMNQENRDKPSIRLVVIRDRCRQAGHWPWPWPPPIVDGNTPGN